MRIHGSIGSGYDDPDRGDAGWGQGIAFAHVSDRPQWRRITDLEQDLGGESASREHGGPVRGAGSWVVQFGWHQQVARVIEGSEWDKRLAESDYLFSVDHV